MERDKIVASLVFLSEIGVWPGPARLDIEGWLKNFESGSDADVACALLAGHVHMDSNQIEYAVASTIQSISSGVEFGELAERPERWHNFLECCLVSFPLGRSDDPTASGYIFARIAKGLGFRENQIFDSEKLARHLSKSKLPPLIFLDDLAASGTQFVDSWERRYPTESGEVSLCDLLKDSPGPLVYYLPIISTQRAKKKIEDECGVRVMPTYLLDETYEALSSTSRITPSNFRPLLKDFLEKYTPKTQGGRDGVSGFGDLGLSISFHHGCPNNTLPVLQWGPRTETWNPLVV